VKSRFSGQETTSGAGYDAALMSNRLHVQMTAYPIDHLVLPTADLDVARARLNVLGFTVAPVGVHPFSTVNCCVYLGGGAFLELLAIGDRAAAKAAIGQGNVFVSRDAMYRKNHGEEGFSALVFGTADAAADHRRFQQLGISAGDMLEFSRPFVDAAGKSDIAGFRLAFAADRQNQDVFFFTCQRVNTPKVDRGTLERHANGVSHLNCVVLGAENPRAFKSLIEQVANRDEVPAQNCGLKITVENGTVFVLDPIELESRFGIITGADIGLRAYAAVFAVADLSEFERLLNRGRIAYERRDQRIVVPAVPGQGATFVFEDAK
jgi:hypothetical protein